MSDTKFYLDPNVLVEPLINQWYAWTYLMAPATAAMFTANSHMKIMQSFMAAPQLHVAALKNPAMLGGPFVDLPPDKVKEVAALFEKTSAQQSHLIEFADAIRVLDNSLTREAKGESLKDFYQPSKVRGYVEVVYDLNNQPSIRFIEGLLYQSPYYDRSLQSVALSLGATSKRSFALSTPRLSKDDVFNVRLPFSDRAYDELFKMKREPGSVEHIQERLGIHAADRKLLSSLFTDKPPASPRPFQDEGLRIRYFGHACILVETKHVSVLCDPLVSYGLDSPEFHYTYDDLPQAIDYVLITQNHSDHFVIETLLQLRHKIKAIFVPKSSGGSLADPSLKLMLQHLGFANVTELDEMEKVEINGGSITGLPFLGNHSDLNIRGKLAYEIRLLNKSVLCAGDSNVLDPKLIEGVHDVIGDIDVLFIGMDCDGAPMSWLYGPLMTNPLSRKLDQARRVNGSNYEQALPLVDRLAPKQVYVYGMGQEPWLSHLMPLQYGEDSPSIRESERLLAQCKQRGLVGERLFLSKEITLT